VATKILLLADNDKDFLETRSEFLQRAGFKIEPAFGLNEARRILERGNIDLAILDLRLLNDGDDKDVSGLDLAMQLAHATPKIILTKYPSYQAVRESLGSKLDSLPPAVGFVAKQEGPQALLTAVQKVLARFDTRFRETADSMALNIRNDYEDARRQARANYWVSLVVAIAGIVIIFLGVSLAMGGFLAIGIPSAVAGVIAEAISFLFFRRADVANERMDRYHHELLEIRWLENLLAACEGLTTTERQEDGKEKIIEAATALWFGHGKPLPSPVSRVGNELAVKEQ
jgi:CheY-like chemotaxis protein